MSYGKRRLIFKAVIESQFTYCHLIWMFYSRTLNNKTNRLHERALRIANSVYKSSFNELLQQGNSFIIHHRNNQSLITEIYQFLNGLFPSIMINVFNILFIFSLFLSLSLSFSLFLSVSLSIKILHLTCFEVVKKKICFE